MNGEEREIEGTSEKGAADEQLSDTVVLDEVAEAQLTETVVITEDGADDDVGDISVELDVDKLVAKLEAADEDDVHHKAEIRRRLEELEEQRAKELDSTFNFNLDEDV